MLFRSTDIFLVGYIFCRLPRMCFSGISLTIMQMWNWSKLDAIVNLLISTVEEYFLRRVVSSYWCRWLWICCSISLWMRLIPCGITGWIRCGGVLAPFGYWRMIERTVVMPCATPIVISCICWLALKQKTKATGLWEFYYRLLTILCRTGAQLGAPVVGETMAVWEGAKGFEAVHMLNWQWSDCEADWMHLMWKRNNKEITPSF